MESKIVSNRKDNQINTFKKLVKLSSRFRMQLVKQFIHMIMMRTISAEL